MINETFRTVWIHPSMRAVAQAKMRADSLNLRAIEHAFHFSGVRQAQLWLEVHRRHAPLHSDPLFEESFRAVFADLAKNQQRNPVHVIGLGAGGGQKENWLIEALQAVGCRRRYTPIDVSLELALHSAEIAYGKADFEIMPIVGDLSLLTDLPAWLQRYPEHETRIYTAFGLTPNFLPSVLLPRLRDVLRPQDKLLLSANLATCVDDSEQSYHNACSAILPQYDNSETRAWLRQVLIDWGIADSLSPLSFSMEMLENLQGFVARAQWVEDIAFPWEGTTFQARKGDTLRLFFSLRYTPKRLEQTLKRYALVLQGGRTTPCGTEGVWQIGI